jgi:hypothetical protein
MSVKDDLEISFENGSVSGLNLLLGKACLDGEAIIDRLQGFVYDLNLLLTLEMLV